MTCERCGLVYAYEMKRNVIGKSSKEVASQAEAEAQASQDADARLKAAFDECDLVACPSCGAITEEMRAQRRKFFGITFACLGIGSGGLLAVYLIAVYFNKFSLFATVMSAVCLLGCLLLIMGLMKQLVPRKGKAVADSKANQRTLIAYDRRDFRHRQRKRRGDRSRAAERSPCARPVASRGACAGVQCGR